MKIHLPLLRLAAAIILLVAAILFFATVRIDVVLGFTALALAAWAASDISS